MTASVETAIHEVTLTCRSVSARPVDEIVTQRLPAAMNPDEVALASYLRRGPAAARGPAAPGSTGCRLPGVVVPQLARAFGRPNVIEPTLAERDLGRSRGRNLDDVRVVDPDGIAAWLPRSGRRIAWRRTTCRTPGARRRHGSPPFLAATHARLSLTPLQSALQMLATLKSPPMAFWRLDVAPLTPFGGRPHRCVTRGHEPLLTRRQNGSALGHAPEPLRP